ncbi:Permease of the drug/metabolite transporter (DMT) superfamily [Parasporobacterium paucivorans DSM 15970]|uniref:Permease of the drug/metabolite transporter (DMT) superfamily n=2 Tax=Parasporobacterium TaxID=115543 RepID=A0A1M6FSN9_9FIRM|nr:Permease of the drug/metabolite transporter (DMT) superfamily [Parasporobacterium paucivorans DSM 15970]
MAINNKNLSGTASALAGGICWGFSGTCGQYLFSEKGVDSDWLSAVRMLSAGIILLGFAFFRQRQSLAGIIKDKKDRKQLLLFGVFGLMICQYTYLTAISHSNAGTATVLQYTGLVILMIVTCVKFRRRPESLEAVALVLAVTGIFLLATQGNPGKLHISGQALSWGMFSAVGLVLYSILPIRLISRWGSMVVTGYGMLAGGIVLSAIVRPWEYVFQPDAVTIIAMAAIILIGTVAAFTLYLKGVSEIGPVKAGMLGSAEPVSAAVFAAIWMHTRFTAADITAFVLIIATVFLLTGKRKKIGAIEKIGNKKRKYERE